MARAKRRQGEIVGQGGACPLCGAPSQRATRPFCSRRCQEIDLGRWLKESYRIPGAPADDAYGERPKEPPPEDEAEQD